MGGRIGRTEKIEDWLFFWVVGRIFDLENDSRGLRFVAIVVGNV